MTTLRSLFSPTCLFHQIPLYFQREGPKSLDDFIQDLQNLFRDHNYHRFEVHDIIEDVRASKIILRVSKIFNNRRHKPSYESVYFFTFDAEGDKIVEMREMKGQDYEERYWGRL